MPNSTSTYVLGTTENIVRWYCFRVSDPNAGKNFELLDTLDLSRVPSFGDKETAKSAAKHLGLRTWRYVRL